MANGHGGIRKGQGRKPKAVELKLLERMDKALGENWDDEILQSAFKEAKKGSYQHQAILLAYKYGKPQDKVDLTTNGKDLPTSKEIVFRRYKD